MNFFRFLDRVDISKWYGEPKVSSVSYNVAKKSYTFNVVVPELVYHKGVPVYFYPADHMNPVKVLSS